MNTRMRVCVRMHENVPAQHYLLTLGLWGGGGERARTEGWGEGGGRWREDTHTRRGREGEGERGGGGGPGVYGGEACEQADDGPVVERPLGGEDLAGGGYE